MWTCPVLEKQHIKFNDCPCLTDDFQLFADLKYFYFQYTNWNVTIKQIKYHTPLPVTCTALVQRSNQVKDTVHSCMVLKLKTLFGCFANMQNIISLSP